MFVFKFITTIKLQGILVPTLVDEITNVSTRNAKFVLVIEKDATFQHLLDGKFTQKFPCILVTVRIILAKFN